MIPSIDYNTIFNFFRMIILFIRWRRIRVENEDDEEDLMIFNLCNNFLHSLLNWLRLILYFFRLRHRLANKRLFKPHLMLPPMAGFRARLLGQDMWTILERNWVHFFWLTGETPDTLRILVQRLQFHFLPHLHIGRQQAIDFRNQVCLDNKLPILSATPTKCAFIF